MTPIPSTPYRTVLVLIVVVGIALLGYTLSVFLPLLQGPSLSVAPFQEAGSRVVQITGTTKRVSFLEINGSPVSLSETGEFSILRAYPPGYTAVEIKARDRFGRETKQIFSLITN